MTNFRPYGNKRGYAKKKARMERRNKHIRQRRLLQETNDDCYKCMYLSSTCATCEQRLRSPF